jgi:hypothetical protein
MLLLKRTEAKRMFKITDPITTEEKASATASLAAINVTHTARDFHHYQSKPTKSLTTSHSTNITSQM